MIYPPKFPSNNDNRAERLVYQALSKLPAVDFDIYYQKTFSGVGIKESDEYEIDFLVIDKRNDRFNAVVIIEVKGGPVSYSAKNNEWYQYNRPMDTAPDDQARKNKHNLIQRFRSLICNVPVGWALWFPEGYSTAGNFTPTNLRPWQIRDYDSLADPAKTIDEIIGEVTRKHHRYRGEPVEVYPNKLAKSLLRGLGIVQPLNILLQKYDEDFLNLQEQQLAFYKNLYQYKRLAISGGAGTGKTLLASGAALDFANEGRKVLLLCFNRMLSLALRSTVGGENVTVNTFHSFAYEYIEEREPGWFEKQDDKEEGFHEFVFPAKLEEVFNKYPPANKWDVLIIDEAQDFNRYWLSVLYKMVKDEGNIILFFDENQNIFRRQFEIPDEESFFPFRLSYNLRNTKKICEFVQAKTGFTVTPWNTPEGMDVKSIEYTDLEDLVKQLKLVLLELVKINKLSLTDIVILIDSGVDEHLLATVSRIGDIELKPWDVNSQRDPGIIYYTSISRFKGLENNVVLLVKDELKDLENNRRFYAQCTRAKSILKLFYKTY